MYNESKEVIKVFSNDNMINNAVNLILENRYVINLIDSNIQNDLLKAHENAFDNKSRKFKKVVIYILEKNNIYSPLFETKLLLKKQSGNDNFE